MSGNYTPEKYMVGQLSESWELTDQQTMTVHLRQGINWQDKAPVNGREFTAEDVVFHYDRLLGTGHGFTAGSPYSAMMTSNWKNVTAVDKYTVQFNFKTPCGGIAFMNIADPAAFNWFEAEEWVALGKDALSDWKQVVGTGPWILSDFVTTTSMTFNRNQNYWGHDRRYPKNQTPYLDSVKLLSITDTATRVAALRTGKIDIMSGVDWQHAQNLADTDLQKAQMPAGSASGVTFRNDLAPFTDIRVRKAMNLAIDRQAIAQSIYHGLTAGEPAGVVTPLYKGYYYAYEDWPQSLKDDYAYNPTKAKELLAEAGFPSGFKTNVVTANSSSELLLTYKDYFKSIGVNVKIKAFADSRALEDFERAGKHDGLADSGAAYDWPPNRTIEQYYSGGVDSSVNGLKWAPDPVIEDLHARFLASKSSDEVQTIMFETDKRVVEQFYGVFLVIGSGYTYWQPYLKGYSNELLGWGQQIMWSGLWVDTDLKKSLGR